MSDTKTEPSVPALPAPPAAASRRRVGSGPALLIGLLALAAAVYVGWRQYALENSRDGATNDELQRVAAQVDALTHRIEQLRGNADTLRARMDDGAKVDQSERQELLGLSERARLLEDAVANLADKRLSGHDALLLNEAELMLALGGERYTLFHDAGAAVAAYRLADTALGEMEDAAFSTVRQSVRAEIDALDALPAADPASLSLRLAQLRAQLPQLQPAATLPASTMQPDRSSRLWRVLGAFVQVHHGEDAQTRLDMHDAGLARELVALDLHEAAAAALARDEARYQAAVAAARAQLNAFDAAAPAVAAAQGELDALGKARLAPPPPQILGAALRELRNLRATHALRAPAKPANAEKPAEAQS
ncbi:MAG: uroporphyrinogen-III C-methyltransferase [Rudaea sp.]|nr:uroporphyrinogen-III C-methyltransferase [Rudaea sp.]